MTVRLTAAVTARTRDHDMLAVRHDAGKHIGAGVRQGDQ
jgi:hypothetical protein